MDTDKAKDRNKDIELRSGKVRNIVGKVPPLLLRIGIFVISIILISLMIAAYFLPYREYKRVEVELFCRPGYQSITMPEDGNVFMTTPTIHVRQGQQVCYIQTSVDSVISFYASFDGKVLFDTSHGDFLRKEDHIYTIIPDSIKSIYGTAYVTEDDIARIDSGQPVGFILTSTTPYIDDRLEGHITKVYPSSSINRGKNKDMYKIEMEFPGYKPAFHDSSFPDFNPNIKGIGQILISDIPVLKRILKFK
ncbi:HlyD family efflux transporter periplasmic adaptor subunit [Dysgonomonas termitidis]|uniref:HlyD family efflux transporter periplasmic adaptor subunit n=1 Tax=Dysgonomonas termitidis TaxID=1516126 RepID=A0ABV9KZS3_9BACT